MATLTGRDGAIIIGSTTIAAVRNFSVEMTADTIEVTVMGNDTRRYLKGMSSFSGSADVYFDPDQYGGTQTLLNITTATSAVGDSPVIFKGYIDSDASNDIAFTGTVIVTGYTVNSSMDGMVEASLSFQGSGGTTFSASGNV
jgi:predicted secreted protein